MESKPEQTLPHCPECKVHVLLVEIQESNYDFECPRCHRKFESLLMEKRRYKLRGYPMETR